QEELEMERRARIREKVADRWDAASLLNKQRYDKRHRPLFFQPGDLVKMRVMQRSDQKQTVPDKVKGGTKLCPPKFSPRWTGPWEVQSRCRGGNSYWIAKEGRQPMPVALEHLLPWDRTQHVGDVPRDGFWEEDAPDTAEATPEGSAEASPEDGPAAATIPPKNTNEPKGPARGKKEKKKRHIQPGERTIRTRSSGPPDVVVPDLRRSGVHDLKIKPMRRMPRLDLEG